MERDRLVLVLGAAVAILAVALVVLAAIVLAPR